MSGRRHSVRKFGAGAAFFALAIQFVLSFGHMHPEDFFPPTGHGPIRLGVPTAPLKPIPAVPVDDACAICINMAMVGASALPPPPPPIVPPLVFGRAIFPTFIAEAPRWTVRVPFRSRAPPSV